MPYQPVVNSDRSLNTSHERRVAIARERQSALGQFLTPSHVADLMVSFYENRYRNIELLDPGAGDGALTGAFVRRLCEKRRKPLSIRVTAYELDSVLLPQLQTTLDVCKERCEQAGIRFSSTIVNEDFISSVVPAIRNELFAPQLPCFNVAIVNPPYGKIRSDSPSRRMLRLVGVETSNIYAGFLAVITKLLTKRGNLIAITPRSFCNGPYFKPFRTDFLETMSLRRLHLFESRSAAFRQDRVLQENIILHAVKTSLKPDRVTVSTSGGAPGSSTKQRRINYHDVVTHTDRIIHVTTDKTQTKAKAIIERLSCSLADLGLKVSTGRVVDFRASRYLCREPNHATVPLIYPAHFSGFHIEWPKPQFRKPNAILSTEDTKDLLLPADIYVLVKRFTSKEERRRVSAAIYDPEIVHASFVGFENHLNYFHINGEGLSRNLARGLTAYLNSTILDQYFRQFSGHTQVNAADLRAMKYPARESLETLGLLMAQSEMPQKELDLVVNKELFA